MKRFTLAMILALLAIIVLIVPASAGRLWCSSDPIFMIDGQQVSVWVSSYGEMTSSATGPVKVILTVPSDVEARLLATDRGFGYGYDVEIVYSGNLVATSASLPTQVEVFAPATNNDLPVKVDLVARGKGRVVSGTAQGMVNEWVVLQTP